MALFDLNEKNDGAPALAPGTMLGGKYRIERVVGEGGMGQVLAATHMGLRQEVAIKIMLADKASNRDSVERFLREARAAVMLKSSHVARVFDVATTDDGLPYIVMELLDGKDLVTVLDESGALQYSDAVDVILQACDAVAEAHALGIIHRDLKPENLFLSRRRDGSPHIKVLDFGISKLGVDATGRNGQRIVTQENTVLGSPTYMSPEQVKDSKRVDERSDIWSLGVSLYELLTAAEPFGADTIPEIFVNVLTATPAAPDQIVADIPSELSAIVMRCLEKDPAARFQSVGEVASALLRFSTGRPSSVSPTWGEGDKGPDSSALLRRLATPPSLSALRAAPAVGSPASHACTIDAEPSSPAPMSLSATIAEARPAKAARKLAFALSVAAVAVVLSAGAAWWRLRQPLAVAAISVAPPSAEAAMPPPPAVAPLPAAAPLEVVPPVTESPLAAVASSAKIAAPRPTGSAPVGVALRPAFAPRPAPRLAVTPPSASPKPAGLPRERTSW